MPSNETIVETREISKVFKDFWGRPKVTAVDRIDFTVCRGEVLGILGPNGSGKSTTIKLLLGLLVPDSGIIRVFDERQDDISIKARIGYLPEDACLYSYLTAEETLKFYGSLFNLSPGESKKRSKELLEMVGLSHAGKRVTGEFSKGMLRRIGIAQALINDPDLIIFDEPTSGLDPIGCREVKSLISFLASRKKTIIICSHLLADIEAVCDNILIMYGGKICARGSLDSLLVDKEKTRITSPVLNQEIIDRVMSILNGYVPDESINVDNPTINLERYFLDVVQRVREKDTTMQGAKASTGIAKYLTEADDILNVYQADKLNARDEEPEGPETTVSSIKLDVLKGRSPKGSPTNEKQREVQNHLDDSNKDRKISKILESLR